MWGRPSAPTVASRPIVWSCRYSISAVLNTLIDSPFGVFDGSPPRHGAPAHLDQKPAHSDTAHARAGHPDHGPQGGHDAHAGHDRRPSLRRSLEADGTVRGHVPVGVPRHL